MNTVRATPTMPVTLDDTKVAVGKTYYAYLDGCTFVMPNGKVCRFEGGEYVTNIKGEIDELEKLCDLEGQHLICRTKVIVKRSDALILKDVGGNRPQQVITTPVSSAGIAGMARS